MTKKLKTIDINKLIEEYSPDFSIFTEDSNLITRLKKIVIEDIDEIDRIILLLYAETQSQREVAKLLGVSASTINIKIKDIRDKIKNILWN